MKDFYILIKNWAYLIFVYLGMGTDVVKVFFYLMVLDTILGVLKAWRLNKKFSFNILKWGIIVKLCFILIPMVVALVAKALNLDFTSFVVSIMWIVIVNEAISIITSMASIKLKKDIKNEDYITKLLMLIRNIMKGMIEKMLKLIEIEKGK